MDVDPDFDSAGRRMTRHSDERTSYLQRECVRTRAGRWLTVVAAAVGDLQYSFWIRVPLIHRNGKKKRAERGFFLHVADKKRFTSRERAELAGRVLQRAQTQAASIGIATTT